MGDRPPIAPAPPAARSEGGGTGSAVKCGAVGCPALAEVPSPCFAEGCEKVVHDACYHRAVVQRFSVEPLVDPVTHLDLVVCSKTCHNKVEKAIIHQPTRLPWDKDGKNGPDDPTNSMNILMDWLTEEGNYSRFRGKDNKGTRKLAYGIQLSNKMKAAGCRVHRSPEAVVKQIQEIEKKFIKAHDWANNTGQGVKERDGEQTFDNLVRSRCKWYFELAPIMADRSKAKPKCTTETLGQRLMDELSNLSSDDDGDDAGNANGGTKGSEGSSPELDRKRSTAAASSSSSVASSSKKKRLKTRVEEQEMAFMESMIKRNEAKANGGNVISERERHNRRMEDIEEARTKWRTKQDELAYKRELISTRRSLEQEGFTKEEILSMFPDMAALYKCHND